MKIHRKYAHESNEVFKCELCDKTFKNPDYMKQHMKTHPGMKPYKCMHCNRDFAQKTHYTKHLESHKIECDQT